MQPSLISGRAGPWSEAIKDAATQEVAQDQATKAGDTVGGSGSQCTGSQRSPTFVAMWVWVKNTAPGDRRFQSLVSFTRVPRWISIFDPIAMWCGNTRAPHRILS